MRKIFSRNRYYKKIEVNKCFYKFSFIIIRKYKNNETAVRNMIESISSPSLKNLLYPVDLNKIFFDLFVESINLIDVNIGHNVKFII